MPVAMARQSLLFKVCTLFTSNSTKLAYNNGITQANLVVPFAGLKTKSPIESHKIPEKPKKPITSYFRYIAEMRPVVSKEDPSLDHKSLIKTIAERWRSLDQEVKAKYEDEYSKDKERYDREILNYNEKLTPEQENVIDQMRADKKSKKKKRKVKQQSKDEGKPKRPSNAYTLYIKESYASDLSLIENIKKCKDAWAQLSEAEKKKYRTISQKNMELYEAELAQWETQMIKDGKPQLVRTKTLQAMKKNTE